MLFKTTVHVHDCTARITTKSVCITQWVLFQVLSTELLQKKKKSTLSVFKKRGDCDKEAKNAATVDNKCTKNNICINNNF